MPLTLTYTEGTLRAENIQDVVTRLTALMLENHGLKNHPVMLPNITATVHALPINCTFSGGQPQTGIWIEWKVPSFAFAERESQTQFCLGASRIVQEATDKRIRPDQVYVNVVHAVDGAWNFNGRPMTNEEILSTLAL